MPRDRAGYQIPGFKLMGEQKNAGVNRNLGKQNIYNITSFNAANKTFGYRVNTTTGVSPLGGTPFQAQMGLRYSF